MLEFLTNLKDETVGNTSAEQRRDILRQPINDCDGIWKSEVNAKLDSMRSQLRTFQSIVIGVLFMQMLIMVWNKKP